MSDFDTFVWMLNRYSIHLLFLFLVNISWASVSTVDSLEVLYKKAASDKERMFLALEIAEAYNELNEAISFVAVAEEMGAGLSAEEQLTLWNKSAKIYAKHGRYQDAAIRLGYIREHHRRNGQRRLEADVLMDIGTYYSRSSRLDLALTNLEEALGLYRTLSDKEGIIDCLNQIGVIHKELNNYSEAITMYHEAYEIARRNGKAKKMAATCVNLGVVLKNQQKYAEAINYYHKAEEIFLIENDNNGLADIYNNLGTVYRNQKNYKAALRNFEKAIHHRTLSGKLDRLSYTYNNLGIVYTEQNDFNKAKEFLTKAEKEKLKYHDYKSLASTYINFSEVYLAQKNTDQYYHYAQMAEKYARMFGQFELVRVVKLNNSQFEAATGNYKGAYEELSELYLDIDTLDLQSQKVLTTVLQAKFSDRQKSTEISQLSESNSLLEREKKALEREKNRTLSLIYILLFVLLFLVFILILLFKNQKALRINQQELRKTNDELIKTTLSIEEKETLLKEIHHRVKNNLQIIKSLIRLQKDTIEDERMDAILLEFEQRVASMALVHESLYRSKDLASVNVREYFESLVRDLVEAYNLDKSIITKLDIYNGSLGIDTLIPLGLLTNEIISNALKYAFTGRENGIITVDLKKISEEELVLIIGDDGIGFDFELERDTSNTLGTELIVALVEQLDGEYTFTSDKGSNFSIRFKSQELNKE